MESRRELLESIGSTSLFDKSITSCFEIIHLDLERGECNGLFKVDERHVNGFRKLHGGVICTLVDIIGSYALIASQPSDAISPGVSSDINVSFFQGTDINSTILVESKVLKKGKKLGFVQVDIKNNETGALLAQGRHTKVLTAPRLDGHLPSKL
ncbi:hypothetical protein AKO1_013575 [Acrasis kona]|uniref:Acyl-coenzyme A thioesterase 13 n=1 Tax=Acrasis kona TaxID=1008807 RepID=A0AAW2YVB8_9EUKA